MPGHRTPTRFPGVIKIGARVRRDMGNLHELARSIARDGLLHPIVVTADETELVCGARRLEAWRLLDRWDSPIPVHLVDIDAIARGEWSENAIRKDLTPSEAVELMRRLRPVAVEAAAARQAALGRWHGADPSGEFPTRGAVRDQVALFTGRSARTLDKADQVVTAAEEQPDLFGKLQEAMDRTGKVHGPWRRLVVARQAIAIRAEPPPLPGNGPYRVLVADPPWPFDAEQVDPTGRGTHPYPQMSYAAIEAFGREVLAITAPDAALWLWTTNHHLPRAFGVLTAWGFEHRTMLTWGKDAIGRGQYLREQTEHCLLAVRGRPTISLSAETTLLTAPRRNHSEKPAAFYDLVQRVCPASRYAELFSHLQGAREGWDRHSTMLPAEVVGGGGDHPEASGVVRAAGMGEARA